MHIHNRCYFKMFENKTANKKQISFRHKQASHIWVTFIEFCYFFLCSRGGQEECGEISEALLGPILKFPIKKYIKPCLKSDKLCHSFIIKEFLIS